MMILNDAFIVGFKSGLKPDPVIDVAEWAEKNRVLSSKSSSESGPWSNERTPYLIEPMNCMGSHSAFEDITLMFGAQLGKTEGLLNATGHSIHNSPGPIMFLQPTEGMAKKFSRQRIEPLFSDTKCLTDLVATAKSRDSSNTILAKDFVGGMLIITGANSASSLASTPVRYLLMDEVDRYPFDVDGEGSPIDLAEARTRTFSMRKKVKTSTPTTKGSSAIEKAFLESDQRYYFVPCPHCKLKQKLEFKNLQWEKGKPETVAYFCTGCGEGIEEHYKTWMLAKENGAEWIATAKAVSPKKVGFHLSSLYSPLGWLSWFDIALAWESAQGNDEKLRAFINTILAETWEIKGDAPDYLKLYNRRESYRIGQVSNGVGVLTMGVDVQGDRLEAHIMGWGLNDESWSVDYRIIPGDTTDESADGPWAKLSELIQHEFAHESGSKLRILATGIDSGFNTQVVYNFVRKHSIFKVYAIKGDEALPTAIGSPKAVEVKTRNVKKSRGVNLWKVGVSLLKTNIYGTLKRELPDADELEANGYPKGYFHFPEHGEEWFKQLTSEQLIPVIFRGVRKYKWVKKYERNEVLDTTVYAKAMTAMLGMESWSEKKWLKILNSIGAVSKSRSKNKDIEVKRKAKPKKAKREREDLGLNIDLNL